MEKSHLIKLVNSRLSEVGHNIEFEIIEAGVRKAESWWYIPVIASRRGKDVPREVTVNIYANLETELEDENNVTVLFIPAVPESLTRGPKSSAGVRRRGPVPARGRK